MAESFVVHPSILPKFGQTFSLLDVVGLGGFVATAKQNDYDLSALHVINPVPRPVVDPHFGQAVAYRFHVTRIARSQAVNPSRYLGDGRRSLSRENQASNVLLLINSTMR